MENALIFLGGTLALAILLREAHGWWLDRDVRKCQKIIRRLEDQYYAEMKQDAIRYVEELYKEVGRR